MKYINQLNNFCLVLAVFFLPVHLNFNNIFITCFICLNLILLFFENRAYKCGLIKQSKWLLTLVSIPFLLNAAGLIYTDELVEGFNYTIRAIPFLCLPLISLINPEVFTKNIKKLGFALVLGCLFVTIYSWSSAIVDIYNQDKSIKELFGPLYSHHNLIKSLSLHSAYLSICIYTSVGFLVFIYKELNMQKKLISVVIICLLIFFMFHLLSRNAIIYFLSASVVFLISKKNWGLLISGSVIVIILAMLAFNVKHNYLRDRIYNSLNFFEKKTQFSKKDDRFDRLSASYEIFKHKPIVGYGTAAESKHRRQIFKNKGDTIAYERNYNAHNQFFEYLSTYGIIGGIAFIIFFLGLFQIILNNRNAFFTYVFIGLFFACVTESVFERSQGVVYTALIIALMLSYSKGNTQLKKIEGV